jgi:hypothetical protein
VIVVLLHGFANLAQPVSGDYKVKIFLLHASYRKAIGA